MSLSWIFLFTVNGSALECYKCESTVQDGDCNHLSSENEDMSRNCTDQPFCMVETFTQHKVPNYEGDLFSVVRDCSDNATYSFKLVYPLTLSLPPKPINVTTNSTVCSFDGNFTVCVLLCNTSFCNGPMQDVSSAWTVGCDIQCIVTLGFVYVLSLAVMLK